MLGTDEFLDAVRDVLIAEGTGVAELTGTPLADLPDPAKPDGNVMVYRFGDADPSDAIAAASNRCKGISVTITDQGGDNLAEDAASPVLDAEAWVDVYINPNLRDRRRNKDLRPPGRIRDDIMQTLHQNATLLRDQHCQYETRVRGYSPVADPEYVVWRIRLTRTIQLHS